MKQQTAVQWFANAIKGLDTSISSYYFFQEMLKQAKEMEKQQQDEFAIDFIKWTISKEADDLIHDLQMVGEVSKFPSTEEVFKVYKRFKNL